MRETTYHFPKRKTVAKEDLVKEMCRELT